MTGFADGGVVELREAPHHRVFNGLQWQPCATGHARNQGICEQWQHNRPAHPHEGRHAALIGGGSCQTRGGGSAATGGGR